MEKTNFKKWGWWALGGVVAAVIVVGLVAMMSTGPATVDDPNGDGQNELVNNGPADTDKTKEKEKEKEETETLPQSGPVENGVLGLLLAGVFAYVVGLSVNSIYRAGREE